MKPSYYIFEIYWQRFHFYNPKAKRDKSIARELWNKSNCIGKKKSIIDDLAKVIKVSALEYLKDNL